MRTLLGALSLALAMNSAPAVACPIDFAPSEEPVRPSNAAIDAHINSLVLNSSVFASDHDVVDSLVAEVKAFAFLEFPALYHGDLMTLGHEINTAQIVGRESVWDMIEALPSPAIMAYLPDALGTTAALLGDAFELDVDSTGDVGAAPALPEQRAIEGF